MNAPHALAPRPRTLVEPDEDTGLIALLDLFSAEEPAPGTAAPARPRLTIRPSARPSLRASCARLLAWSRESSRRAAAWGSGPEGAWRAW
ncbi:MULTISPECIES: hypothetical protein [unclassified Blastococcus]